ncbi:hypothetical protein [Hymenobacter sp. B81]|uniref:hypothetical protein n=1 Tax=Hymenobacter sp. B81 TaxID=3344878 RepID=UPI0037DCAAE6
MPTYSIPLLTTPAACDEVLTPARRAQALLQHRAVNLTFDGSQAEGRAALAQAELLGVAAELAAANTVLAALPTGPSTKRTQYEIKKEQLEAKQRLLQGHSGNTALLLDRELDQARNAAELAEVTAFIVAVEAHRATLPG